MAVMVIHKIIKRSKREVSNSDNDGLTQRRLRFVPFFRRIIADILPTSLLMIATPKIAKMATLPFMGSNCPHWEASVRPCHQLRCSLQRMGQQCLKGIRWRGNGSEAWVVKKRQMVPTLSQILSPLQAIGREPIDVWVLPPKRVQKERRKSWYKNYERRDPANRGDIHKATISKFHVLISGHTHCTVQELTGFYWYSTVDRATFNGHCAINGSLGHSESDAISTVGRLTPSTTPEAGTITSFER